MLDYDEVTTAASVQCDVTGYQLWYCGRHFKFNGASTVFVNTFFIENSKNCNYDKENVQRNSFID